jgi:transposase InsO family protein
MFDMAIKRRKPKYRLIWHTDRGSQYASHAHKDLLQEHGIVQSMSRKGNVGIMLLQRFFSLFKN